MKKLIAIVLVGVLVTSGLGSIAYASEEPVNDVHAQFVTNWHYDVPGDSFTNDEVTGSKLWAAHVRNWPDETGAPVTSANLSLDSGLEFDHIWPEENLTKTGPPTYEWFFGDVPEGSHLEGRAGNFPVTFTPGFDASRSVDKTIFTATDNQTITITLTPLEVINYFHLYVETWEDDLVNPVITSPTTDESQGIWLAPDGHHLDMHLTGLSANTTYTYYVTINVTPKVPEVKFMPRVTIDWPQHLASGTTTGNSVSHPVEQVGTWTWSADGSYEWHWGEDLFKGVTFPGYSRTDYLRAHFITSWKYSPPEDTFTNDNVTGSRQWAAKIQNRLYATGETLASANLTLASDLEFDFIYPEPETMGPSTYEWLFGEIPVGGGKEVHVASESSNVTFTPGFDASRSADKTVFDAPGTQTLTITVTPREAMDSIGMNVAANYPDWLNAAITSCKLEDGSGGEFKFDLSPDGYWLWTHLDDPVVNTKYTYTVTIEVTPTVPKVECLPLVQVVNLPKGPIIPGGTGSSLTYATVDGMGTWTWSTGGSYPWAIAAGEPFRSVDWQRSCRDLTNCVEARFVTALNYSPVGPGADTFTNGDEISAFWKDWDAKMDNPPDASGANVTALTLRLDSEVPFNAIRNLENLTQMGPPTYEWSFGDVPEGSDMEQAKGAVQLMFEWYQPYGPEPPITFTPGFDASRSVDKAVFTATDNQTLTVTVTPREQERTEGLDIHLGFDNNDLVEAVITSWSGGEGHIMLLPDGKLGIHPTGLVIDTTWSIDVTFQVTPKKPKVYFIPYIQVGWNETITSGTTPTPTSSLSYPAGDDPVEEPGTWTWSAEGSYRWYWVEELRPAVHWFPRCREIVNTPPVAQASVDPYLAPVGSDFTFDGSASSDEDGTIVSWDWDFGDGNTGSGVTLDHAYEFAGLYNVTLMVTDDMGAESTDSVMAVVYDPTAGFATGGGWFIPGGKTSYDNDYLPNIDGTSPANFGFVVKYKKGASTPDGQLEFQYQQGDFNLHSSGMEWLVITNKNWAKFQGLAIIKGYDGIYPFHVDARDGDFGGRDQPDRFIIKVWAPGADPDKDELIYKASGDLEGGNIVIHGKGYEVTTLRLQSWYQPDDPLMTPLENFAQAVEQGTEGSVRIELYSTAAPIMPNLWELADAIKWGDVEMGLIFSSLLRDYSRVLDAGWLPFLYNDDDGLTAAVQDGIGDLMSQEMVAHNINVLDWTTTGFSHLYSRQVMLDHPDDLTQDVKIRVVGGIGGTHEGMQWEAMTEWGGTPVTLPMSEIYELLEKEYINGAMHSPYQYDAWKFYEVAPYFSVDYAFANLAGLCINSDVWNSLDEVQRQAITEAAGTYANEMLATVKQLDADALQRIGGYEGVTVYTLPDEERAVWRQASQSVWEGWLEELGDARPVGEQIIDIALGYNPLP